MSFLFPSLLMIGLPLIALPPLIHLINLRRHRRVQWAAMDFLLESQKRNKNWILLRQFLLLFLRTAAIAFIVFMLAGPVIKSQWGNLLGRGSTHHVILLDDSYSMSDRWEQSSAWREAQRVVGQLLEEATLNPTNQKVTLLKFSEAAELSAGEELAVWEQPLDRQSADEVSAYVGRQQVSETDAGPLDALQALSGLPEQPADESRVVYLVSDFRVNQWATDPQVRQLLSEVREQNSLVHLIQCVESTRQNLAITGLEPEAGIRSAGVETWMQLTVTNFSDQPATNVIASLTQDGQRLPAVEFDEIPPRGEATRRFRVLFASAGAHHVEAELPSDAVLADNVRHFACDIPSAYPLLIIDGSKDGDDGYYLRTALSPGGSAKPGWSPRTEPASYLRKHEELSQYAAIFLLDVARLDDTEVEALEMYVENGGGLAVFVGPQVDRSFYNERFYREGSGLLPAPLEVPSQLVRRRGESIPDVAVEDHPVFRIFAGQRNSFLNITSVDFYYALEANWQDENPVTRVIASLRNDAPLVIEKPYGDGRVVAHLSKLSPKETPQGVWSNWSLNPVFPVVANELAGYLSSSQRHYDTQVVGSRLQFNLPEADYEPEIRVLGPADQGGEGLTLTPQAEDGQYLIDAGRATQSGLWQFELQKRTGETERRVIAVNVPVDSDEGDLRHLGRETLAKALEGTDYQFSYASQMSPTEESLAGFKLSDTFLMLLLLALVIEQWLAYKASYHS